MKTICTDIDGANKTIAEAIENNLGAEYSYISRIINFKNHGACSSRQRTVVIGVSKDYADEVSPLELYPDLVEEKTLRQVIGDLKPLTEFGEIDENDIYHSFRVYPEHMRAWISDIKEGESAFDNVDDCKKPHQVKDGKIVINQQKNGDKYKRQYWNKVGPCIHTRNDQLASQNTIHPSDDRVFSIRELMMMMTVPYSFKWVEEDLEALNQLPAAKKRAFLKKEEIKIRQSLGEAVPTAIFQAIAKKIVDVLKHTPINTTTINIGNIKNEKQEIGSRESIEAQIEKLISQKDTLSTDLNLSKEELDLYDKTIEEFGIINEQILSLQKDLTNIQEIENVVEKRTFNFSLSDHIQELIGRATDDAITAANTLWVQSKQTIIDGITKELVEKESQRDQLLEIRDGLKPKIQENKIISELSNNIQKESEKLKDLTAIEKKEAALIEKENTYIYDICQSIGKFKGFHIQYAQTVNRKSEFKSNDLEFSVGVPFKKEAYVDKVLRLFDNRSTILKDTISIDAFSEDQYTEQLLQEFISKILDEKLQPKKGNTQETVIRELCDDWFEIKYNVRMDNDTIDVMSPGKKALVLLKLLIDLADSKCPILIDQPEDDLDNRSVFNDLIPFIKRKKKDRQIIIVTHNANVVLGSDAEEVIVANQQGSNVPNKHYRFEYRSGSIENNLPLYTVNGEAELGILNSQGI